MGLLILLFFLGRSFLPERQVDKKSLHSEQGSISGYEFSEDEKEFDRNFCSTVINGNEEGMFLTDVRRAQGIDWDEYFYCFTEKDTKLLKLQMIDGELQKPILMETISHLDVMFQENRNRNFSIDESVLESDIDFSYFGTCRHERRLIMSLSQEQPILVDGWYVTSLCSLESEEDREHITNMKGNYLEIFKKAEELVLEFE